MVKTFRLMNKIVKLDETIINKDMSQLKLGEGDNVIINEGLKNKEEQNV